LARRGSCAPPLTGITEEERPAKLQRLRLSASEPNLNSYISEDEDEPIKPSQQPIFFHNQQLLQQQPALKPLHRLEKPSKEFIPPINTFNLDETASNNLDQWNQFRGSNAGQPPFSPTTPSSDGALDLLYFVSQHHQQPQPKSNSETVKLPSISSLNLEGGSSSSSSSSSSSASSNNQLYHQTTFPSKTSTAFLLSKDHDASLQNLFNYANNNSSSTPNNTPISPIQNPDSSNIHSSTFSPPMFTLNSSSIKSSKSVPNLQKLDALLNSNNQQQQQQPNLNYTYDPHYLQNRRNSTTAPAFGFTISHPDLMAYSGMTFLGGTKKK